MEAKRNWNLLRINSDDNKQNYRCFHYFHNFCFIVIRCKDNTQKKFSEIKKKQMKENEQFKRRKQTYEMREGKNIIQQARGKYSCAWNMNFNIFRSLFLHSFHIFYFSFLLLSILLDSHSFETTI